MQFGGRKPRSARTRESVLDSVGSGHGNYKDGHKLQFYTFPPIENISLQEFEDFAVDRLKVLKAVETVGIRCVKSSKEYNEMLEKELKALKVMKGMTSTSKSEKNSEKLSSEELEERRKDHISHFILRLAYCRSEELRRWFISQEIDLFRFRFGKETRSSTLNFLKQNNLDYEPIPDDERRTLLPELSASHHGPAGGNMIEHTNFYKVPFTEVLDLVRCRKVYINHGSAYVEQDDLVVIILSAFRTNLSHALAVTSRALPHLEEDDRLLPMLKSLSNRYLGQDYSSKKTNTGTITAEMIDTLNKKSFPLCMQTLHQSLRQHHHLRHWGRQQYGLFLKGIGLSLDEALRFWRTEFSKLVGPDKFDKQYAYNIRHNYGKEGKRADYTPYSCIKVITTNAPATGDYHGCPFRHTDSDLLKQQLHSKSVPKDVTDEIVQLCKGQHYQVACGRYFEHMHKVDFKFNPNHPNQYFDESQKILHGDKPIDTPQKPTRSLLGPPSQSQRSQSQQANNTASNDTTVGDSTVDEFDDFPLTCEDVDMAMTSLETQAA